jgi:hypothetical protein
MATKRLETKEQIDDFVRGCTFFGTGGGGKPEDGTGELYRIMGLGKTIEWTDANDISDDEVSVCPFLMGSIAPWTSDLVEEMKSFGLTKQYHDNLLVKSTELLSKYTGEKPTVIVPIELGGANTPTAVAAAAELGISVVDGDYTGRAIPEIPQTTPFLHGKDLLPISSWDRWGNVCFIADAVNPLMAERIGKLISTAAYGLTGQAGFLMPAREMKEVLIRGTLTECLEIGRTIREERTAGRDPINRVLTQTGGKLLFKGTVSKKEWEDKIGYYWGTHEISGEGQYEGKTFKIWFKNENHISWLNEEVFLTSPDLIIVVRSDDCEPLANPAINEGMRVLVIGLRAREQFLIEKGINILGPRHFGFDYEYRPFLSLIE